MAAKKHKRRQQRKKEIRRQNNGPSAPLISESLFSVFCLLSSFVLFVLFCGHSSSLPAER
jgi:hypothetical protein